MPAKQTVTLGKIVDVAGTVYGPGTITVPQHIATRLIQYHDAQPGAIITEDVADLLAMPVDQLTAEQLQAVIDHKRGVTAPTAPAEGTPAPAPIVKNNAEPAMGVVAEILKLDINEIRRQLSEKQVQAPSNANKRALAELLATAAGYKLDSGGEPAPPAQPQPTTGPLPEKYPAREKLIALGLDTIEKVRAAKPEALTTLDQNEKDLVAVELATAPQ